MLKYVMLFKNYSFQSRRRIRKILERCKTKYSRGFEEQNRSLKEMCLENVRDQRRCDLRLMGLKERKK